MKTFASQLLAASAIASLLSACSGTSDPQPTGPYTNGVVVLNAGNFSDNNGSLSWLTREGKTAENDLFQRRNRRPLTGLVQGYTEVGNRGLILVDNSSAGLDRVEIVTADSLRSVKTLGAPDIENPRQAVRISDTKVYITCYGATGTFPNFFVSPGYVAVIDLRTNTVTRKIPLQKGAEGITVVGNEAFVGSADGSDKVITIIDSQTDAVKSTIPVSTVINRLELDANNKLWGFAGNTAIRIDPTTKAVEATLAVGPANSPKTPGNLTPSADRRSFFFTYSFYDPADDFRLKGELYRFNITDAAISTNAPIVRRVFSGIGLDPVSGVLYAGVTPSFKQAGYVLRYQPTGQVIDSVTVEIAPSGFWFK